MSESDQKEKKGVPSHSALLKQMISQGDTKPLRGNVYTAMEEAILECQSEVLLGVNPRWVEWAKTVEDPAIFSEASGIHELIVLATATGHEFSRHRMILGPVPKWDEPSHRPYILTCPGFYVKGQEFVENGRIRLQNYYEDRYQQAYAQLTLTKEVGKTRYYRDHNAGFGTTFFPHHLDQDKKAAMHLTFCAYKKAAEDIGTMTVHFTLLPSIEKGDYKKAESEKTRLEREFKPNGVLKFEVGTLSKAMEQDWDKAVFENLGSCLSVGGDALNNRTLERMIAVDYALIETQSSTLNATLRDTYSFAKDLRDEARKDFHVINPGEAGPMPELPISSSYQEFPRETVLSLLRSWDQKPRLSLRIGFTPMRAMEDFRVINLEEAGPIPELLCQVEDSKRQSENVPTRPTTVPSFFRSQDQKLRLITTPSPQADEGLRSIAKALNVVYAFSLFIAVLVPLTLFAAVGHVRNQPKQERPDNTYRHLPPHS